MSGILVVGGGAAGLVAAWRAAELGHPVTLLEANGRLAVKVGLSGGGRCNVTHGGTVDALLAAFPKPQTRFLRPALHAFSNRDLVALLQREGLETCERENGRVFPVEGQGARDVVRILAGLARRSGVEIHFGARVAGLRGRAPRLEAVELETGEILAADAFILATGGASYPGTGSRGEALAWLAALGVPARSWFPALAPIPLARPRSGFEGVALRGGRLRLRAGREGRRLAEWVGDVLFTRSGLSGPAALELSEAVEAARRDGAAWLSWGARADPPEALEASLLEEQRANPHLSLHNWLQHWLPRRVCGPALEEVGLVPEQRLKNLSRTARRALLGLALDFPLGEPLAVRLEQGEVCAGGVRLAAVDPRTLLLRGWDNLRVCGELLDVNGPVGGYNLQAAFSTGFLAGSLRPYSA